jgi:hypothetical protein
VKAPTASCESMAAVTGSSLWVYWLAPRLVRRVYPEFVIARTAFAPLHGWLRCTVLRLCDRLQIAPGYTRASIRPVRLSPPAPVKRAGLLHVADLLA